MGFEVLSGNGLVVQGGLEAGFSLYTGYPGSPLADYFTILHGRRAELARRGVRVAIANSEANAAAMAGGAKQAGRDTLVAMKSMGLHVASDALSVGNFAEPGGFVEEEGGRRRHPGVVVVVGDDPWSISTSAPVDSRYLFKHLHIPFLEPATPQELKDWMGRALALSREHSVYQGVVLTTFMAEGGGRVETFPEAPVDPGRRLLDPGSFDLAKNVMVPPNSLAADASMVRGRFPRVLAAHEAMGLDRLEGPEGAPVGLAAAGSVFETARQVLEERGLLGRVSLFKPAGSFPLVEGRLLPWMRGLSDLVVVEEKRGFLEGALRELAQREGLALGIHGKAFGGEEGFPAHGGLSHGIVDRALARLLPRLLPRPGAGARADSGPAAAAAFPSPLPRRLPTFCPGCPHRETLSVLKSLRRTLDKEGIPLVSHGDVGCYSLSFLPPFKEMHNLSAMGQGGALGAGLDIFTDNPSVVLMGDSTFFHSGVTDVSNSVQLGHDVTYILLDNDNTAMTGHQMTPVTGVSVEGAPRPRQGILETVRALGVARALEVNPSDRYFYQNLLLSLVRSPGVKVVVSKKECALTWHGRARAREREALARGPLKEKVLYQINVLVCEDCRVCVEETGCPGLTQVTDPYGTKVAIDPQICVADSYCTKIKACPSFERVVVEGYRPPAPALGGGAGGGGDDGGPPPPGDPATLDAVAAGGPWRAVVTGVGGSGVTTVSRVLARAAASMGGRTDLDFRFVDQKGLAQRNGNVTGHIALFRKGTSQGAVTPEGAADLYLSPDLLDGAAHLRFLSPGGTAVIDAEHQVPLSLLLDAGEERPPATREGVEEGLRSALGARLVCRPMKSLSRRALGKGVYASAMLLGAAWQRGALPFGLADLREAFAGALGREGPANWRAFRLGREVVAEGWDGVSGRFPEASAEPGVPDYRRSVRESLPPWRSARPVLGAFDRGLEDLGRRLPGVPGGHLARYLHDVCVYGGARGAEGFVRDAGRLPALYGDGEERARALRTLARTHFVKDEVFVSHMALSPLKRKRDEALHGPLGRRHRVVPINRPSFDVLGAKIEFDVNPRRWMLRAMRRCRFLRALLPAWHAGEREAARRIRRELLEAVPGAPPGERRRRLARLENVKGFREVRLAKAARALDGAPAA